MTHFILCLTKEMLPIRLLLLLVWDVRWHVKCSCFVNRSSWRLVELPGWLWRLALGIGRLWRKTKIFSVFSWCIVHCCNIVRFMFTCLENERQSLLCKFQKVLSLKPKDLSVHYITVLLQVSCYRLYLLFHSGVQWV